MSQDMEAVKSHLDKIQASINKLVGSRYFLRGKNEVFKEALKVLKEDLVKFVENSEEENLKERFPFEQEKLDIIKEALDALRQEVARYDLDEKEKDFIRDFIVACKNWNQVYETKNVEGNTKAIYNILNYSNSMCSTANYMTELRYQAERIGKYYNHIVNQDLVFIENIKDMINY